MLKLLFIQPQVTLKVVSHPRQEYFLHAILQDNISALINRKREVTHTWCLWCSLVQERQELGSKRRKQSRSCDATCCARTSPDSSGARLAHGHPVTERWNPRSLGSRSR